MPKLYSALAKLRHQQAFLNASANDLAVTQLTYAFSAACALLTPETGVTDAIATAVEHDLIYCILRHQRFCQAPILGELIIDYLSAQYRLAHAPAALLTGHLLRVAQSWQVDPTFTDGASDKEFLRYVCVASATACDETTLIIDLGFGDALTTRIKESVRSLVVQSSTASNATSSAARRFLPAVDACIAETMCELSRDMRTHPHALQLHRLRFLLQAGQEASRILDGNCTLAEVRPLFELLLSLGGRGTMNQKQIGSRLAKLAPETFTAAPTEELITAVMQALTQARLVINLAGGTSVSVWQALPLAQELTADAYARNVLNSPGSPWRDLAAQCGPYQAALILAAPDLDVASICQQILPVRPLAKVATQAALTRLWSIGGADSVAHAVTTLLTQDASPWVRLALCEIIEDFPERLPIGQLLGEMAKSDSSAAVQTAALRAFWRHELAANPTANGSIVHDQSRRLSTSATRPAPRSERDQSAG